MGRAADRPASSSPSSTTPRSSGSTPLPSILLVLAGFLVSLVVCKAFFGERPIAAQGPHPAQPGARRRVTRSWSTSTTSTTSTRRSSSTRIAHPIAKAAYWINQNVIDGIVNGVGIGGRKTGDWVYRNVDQRVVDGAVNGSGAVARGTGGALQPVQSGKVNQYGALLFGAAAVGALVLVTRQHARGTAWNVLSTTNNWLLSLGTFLPLAGVLVMLFIPKRGGGAGQAASRIVTAAATLAVGIYTLTQFDYDQAGEAAVLRRPTTWIQPIKATYTIGLDGISLPLYLLSMVITLLVMIYSWDHIPEPGNPKAFFILMLVLQIGMAGTFIAQDLILFFVFFEVVLLPMYFMIGVWGGEQRQYASLKFFLYTMFGSALMLVSFLALFVITKGNSATRTGQLHVPVVPRARRRRSPRTPRSGSSPACSSASPSRCRCSRSTPGCPTPTPRRRRRAR